MVVFVLLPVSAVAHTKLFYKMSCRSDYRKVEVTMVTAEPSVTLEPTGMPTIESTAPPLVEIPLESTLPPEPTLTPIPTEASIPTPSVEIADPEAVKKPTDQITTPSDVDTPTIPPEEVL